MRVWLVLIGVVIGVVGVPCGCSGSCQSSGVNEGCPLHLPGGCEGEVRALFETCAIGPFIKGYPVALFTPLPPLPSSGLLLAQYPLIALSPLQVCAQPPPSPIRSLFVVPQNISSFLASSVSYNLVDSQFFVRFTCLEYPCNVTWTGHVDCNFLILPGLGTLSVTALVLASLVLLASVLTLGLALRAGVYSVQLLVILVLLVVSSAVLLAFWGVFAFVTRNGQVVSTILLLDALRSFLLFAGLAPLLLLVSSWMHSIHESRSRALDIATWSLLALFFVVIVVVTAISLVWSRTIVDNPLDVDLTSELTASLIRLRVGTGISFLVVQSLLAMVLTAYGVVMLRRNVVEARVLLMTQLVLLVAVTVVQAVAVIMQDVQALSAETALLRSSSIAAPGSLFLVTSWGEYFFFLVCGVLIPYIVPPLVIIFLVSRNLFSMLHRRHHRGRDKEEEEGDLDVPLMIPKQYSDV